MPPNQNWSRYLRVCGIHFGTSFAAFRLPDLSFTLCRHTDIPRDSWEPFRDTPIHSAIAPVEVIRRGRPTELSPSHRIIFEAIGLLQSVFKTWTYHFILYVCFSNASRHSLIFRKAENVASTLHFLYLFQTENTCRLYSHGINMPFFRKRGRPSAKILSGAPRITMRCSLPCRNQGP